MAASIRTLHAAKLVNRLPGHDHEPAQKKSVHSADPFHKEGGVLQLYPMMQMTPSAQTRMETDFIMQCICSHHAMNSNSDSRSAGGVHVEESHDDRLAFISNFSESDIFISNWKSTMDPKEDDKIHG